MLCYTSYTNYLYTRYLYKCKYKRGRGMYTKPGRWKINHSEYPLTQWFFIKVHLLAGKLVPVVAIHPLGGSRANRHHTPNPQSGAAQPTQDGDPQAMSNPLEYLLAPCREKVNNPSQSPRPEPETITFLRSTILAAPSRLDGGNHQEKHAKSAAKHNH